MKKQIFITSVIVIFLTKSSCSFVSSNVSYKWVPLEKQTRIDKKGTITEESIEIYFSDPKFVNNNIILRAFKNIYISEYDAIERNVYSISKQVKITEIRKDDRLSIGLLYSAFLAAVPWIMPGSDFLSNEDLNLSEEEQKNKIKKNRITLSALMIPLGILASYSYFQPEVSRKQEDTGKTQEELYYKAPTDYVFKTKYIENKAVPLAGFKFQIESNDMQFKADNTVFYKNIIAITDENGFLKIETNEKQRGKDEAIANFIDAYKSDLTSEGTVLLKNKILVSNYLESKKKSFQIGLVEGDLNIENKLEFPKKFTIELNDYSIKNTIEELVSTLIEEKINYFVKNVKIQLESLEYRKPIGWAWIDIRGEFINPELIAQRYFKGELLTKAISKIKDFTKDRKKIMTNEKGEIELSWHTEKPLIIEIYHPKYKDVKATLDFGKGKGAKKIILIPEKGSDKDVVVIDINIY